MTLVLRLCVRPPVCQLNCSGHGECDPFTRRCVCQPFWMENFIRAQFGEVESNCGESKWALRHPDLPTQVCQQPTQAHSVCFLLSDWSVLYVTIASFMVVVAIATAVWGMVCCCNR